MKCYQNGFAQNEDFINNGITLLKRKEISVLELEEINLTFNEICFKHFCKKCFKSTKKDHYLSLGSK